MISIESFIEKKMSEQLKCIIRLQEVFCVRIADIAYLLNISKDDAYYCLDDKNISKSILISLNKLVEIADIFDKEKIDRLDKFLDRPLTNSPLLIEFLKDVVDKGFIEKKKIRKIVSLIKAISEKEKENRAKPKGSGKNLRSLEDVMGDFSSVYIEEK